MKKVLIFGDSHIGNIAAVSNEIETNLQITFLTAPGPICKYLKVTDNELTLLPAPKEFPAHQTKSNEELHNWYDISKNRIRTISGGKDVITLSDFDEIVIYGGHFISLAYRWWDILRMKGLYSLGLQSDILKTSVLTCMAYKWASDLSNYISKGGKMFLVLPPLLNEKGLSGQHDCAQPLSVFQETPPDVDFRDMLPFYSHLLKGMGGNLIEFPDCLLSEDGRGTAAKYKSLNPIDFYHLNPDGAKLVLKKIIDSLQ